MKVELPYIVQDQLVQQAKGMKPVDRFSFDSTGDRFLAGPVSRRVAILDFDETTGDLRPGVPFLPANDEEEAGRFDVDVDPADRDFQNVSVFATVMRTIAEFEDPDVLGRPVVWAFDGPQLLVVPRAGGWANAFYDRDSRSLQFFYFDSEKYGRTVHTSASHDIVAHETGHAILDGIQPDLYDATTPQALALHEAIADLTSLVMSLRSNELLKAVLEQNGGTIEGGTALSAVAEEFGRALNHGSYSLRNLWNDKRLDQVDDVSPHALSEVLSGALFRVLHETHEERKQARIADLRADNPDLDERTIGMSRSGRPLWVAGRIFRRMVFRALDYLPPGEVSFADYGRAICAADESANPDHGRYRDMLAAEFARRGIAGSSEALTKKLRPSRSWVPDVDLDGLLESDWVAYEFVNRERKRLRIPDGEPFRVLPRLDVEKTTFRGADGEHHFRELILKVAWERFEEDTLSYGLPTRRAVPAGTTLVISRESGEVRALLTTENSAALKKSRSRFVKSLAERGLLTPGPDGAVDADVADDVLRIRGTGRSLHITEGGDAR